MLEHTEVAIIGGGISGCAAAYELARSGTRVTLLERGEIASMASGWTLGGVRVSGRHPAEIPLAHAAIQRWAGLADELDAETDYVRSGNLRLARDAAERRRSDPHPHYRDQCRGESSLPIGAFGLDRFGTSGVGRARLHG